MDEKKLKILSNLSETKISKLSQEDYLKYRVEIKNFFIKKKKERKEYFKTRRQTIKKRKKRKITDKFISPEFKDGQRCKQCLEFKVFSKFSDSSRFKNGKLLICKNCVKFNKLVDKYENPNRAISMNLRTRINKALKAQCYHNRTESLTKLLGCSIEELKNHLKSKFESGMNFGNHSFRGWHIDHILPCASFDLSKASERLKCFHYTNLQPLWAEDNLKKGSKIL